MAQKKNDQLIQLNVLASFPQFYTRRPHNTFHPKELTHCQDLSHGSPSSAAIEGTTVPPAALPSTILSFDYFGYTVALHQNFCVHLGCSTIHGFTSARLTISGRQLSQHQISLTYDKFNFYLHRWVFEDGWECCKVDVSTKE